MVLQCTAEAVVVIDTDAEVGPAVFEHSAVGAKRKAGRSPGSEPRRPGGGNLTEPGEWNASTRSCRLRRPLRWNLLDTGTLRYDATSAALLFGCN
jgi:hypothetical protein